MTMRPFPATALVLVAALGLGGPSAAQPAGAPPEPSATPPTVERERAVELFRRANEAYKEDRYEDAAALFEQAWQLARTYDIAANYGHTAFQLGWHRQAAELLSLALARWPQTGPTAAKQAAIDRLAEAREHVGALRLAISPSGAHVRLDGTEVGVAPLEAEIFVEPGLHVVEAELDGYEPARTEIDTPAGTTGEATLALRRADLSPPPGPPDTAVEEPSTVPPIIVGAVGLVGVGLGIGLLALSGRKAGEADDALAAIQAEAGYPNACHETSPFAESAECASVRELREDHDTFQNAGAATLAVGGAALAASALWLGILLSSDSWEDSQSAGVSGSSSTSSLGLRPWILPSPAQPKAGIAVEGIF